MCSVWRMRVYHWLSWKQVRNAKHEGWCVRCGDVSERLAIGEMSHDPPEWLMRVMIWAGLSSGDQPQQQNHTKTPLMLGFHPCGALGRCLAAWWTVTFVWKGNVRIPRTSYKHVL